MHEESTVTVSAPADRVWAIYREVERWSEWTASITAVELLDPSPDSTLAVGRRARVVQPRLPTAEWTVTEWIEPYDPAAPGLRSFSWVSTGPGVRTTGTHLVRSLDPQTCVATAALTQQGPLGILFGLVYRRLTRRYLDWETAGLQARAEATSTDPS